MNVTYAETEQHFMAEALRLAARIPVRPWPNPPVGAVVVRDGHVVGRGSHHGAGRRHAEVKALAEAGEASRGATLYCSLEPCNHTGRTPPCAPVILASGVRRVVVGVRDSNPTVSGGGLPYLIEHGVEVRVGVLAEQALELIWPFVVTGAFTRPFVLLKTATSLDGRFSVGDPPTAGRSSVRSHDSTPTGVTGPGYLTQLPARHDVHVMRRWMDLILVGEGTVRSDRPRLDGRLVNTQDNCPRAEPLMGYVDSDLSYTEGWERDHYLVFTGQAGANGDEVARAVSADGGEVVRCEERDGHVDPLALLRAAHERGIQTIMVEGGPRLAAAFLASGAVDRWVQYLAPLVAGRGSQWPRGEPRGETRVKPRVITAEDPAEFHLTSSECLGRDLRLVYDRSSFRQALAEVAEVKVTEVSGDQVQPARGRR